MANICFFKGKVKGRKSACEAYLKTIPLYTADLDVYYASDDEDDTEIYYTGDCKWHVDCYTGNHENVKPLTDEEIAKTDWGHYWEYPLIEKTVLFGVEIWSNGKDIDDYGMSDYRHYKDGKQVDDTCPKPLHIKRGRDYDCYGMSPSLSSMVQAALAAEASDSSEDGLPKINLDSVIGHIYKVRFINGGAYYYYYEDGNEQTLHNKEGLSDIVYVSGAKKNTIGIVEDCTDAVAEKCFGYETITKVVSAIPTFCYEDVELIWKNANKDGKSQLMAYVGDTSGKNSKDKFIKQLSNKWIQNALDGLSWGQFTEKVKNAIK